MLHQWLESTEFTTVVSQLHMTNQWLVRSGKAGNIYENPILPISFMWKTLAAISYPTWL